MNLKTIFDAFGTKLIEDIQKSLISKGVDSDGQNSRLGDSVRFYYTEINGNPVFHLSMNDYWEVVDGGRAPNKAAPPIEHLEKWIKRKGIKPKISLRKERITKGIKNKTVKKSYKSQNREKAIKAMAFAMSKSIGKKGFEGNKFVEEILNDGRVEILQKEVSAYMRKEITIAFKKAA